MSEVQQKARPRRKIALKGDSKELLQKARERKEPRENEGELRAKAREEILQEEARAAGTAAATDGAKQKSNPHEAGSPLWWAWHSGYTLTKKIMADAARAEVHRAAAEGRKAKASASASKTKKVVEAPKKKKR